MSTLILPPRVEEAEKRRHITEFVDVAKSFLAGNAATLGAGQQPGSPMKTSWTNQQGNTALMQRATQNFAQQHNVPVAELEQALADQGLSWGAPFAPGRPLDPFYGYRQPPRTWDYSVGENIQVTPRWDRISFNTLKAIYNAYDVAQICARHLINDVRSLDYAWQPLEGVKDDVSEDVATARAFFDSPDRRLPFRGWLHKLLQDVIRYDAGCLYIRRNKAGDPIALEVVNGTTIIPLIDFYGRVPTDENDATAKQGEDWEDDQIVPAYQQIIEGMPWDWLTASDVIYMPWNPMPDSQYGLAPMEAVLLSANTDMRFQYHFLQYFTEGTLPAGFMEAPPDMSDPAQLTEWQDTWDALMMGDQAKLRQIRWVPAGAKFTPVKNNDFAEEFPLYLMRRTCAAHGITPADLGFTENVNKSSGDTQIDIQFRVGTRPLLQHVQDIINLFVSRELKLRVVFRFDDGRETEDRVASAQAAQIYIDSGVISPDETRQELGYPVDNDRPVPRFINNARNGPISLLSVDSGSGKIDPETYAPSKDQPLVSTPPAPFAGILPPQKSPEEMAASAQQAQTGRDLIEATTGKSPATAAPAPDEDQQTPKSPGDLNSDDQEAAEKNPDGSAPKKPSDAAPPDDQDMLAQKEATAGINALTGIQGVDLIGDEDDEDDEEDVAKAFIDLELRRWRKSSHSRLKKGQHTRPFSSSILPADVHAQVWAKLETAQTRDEIDRAFKSADPKDQARLAGFHRNTDQVTQHYGPLIADAMKVVFAQAVVERAIRSGKPAALKVLEDGKGSTAELEKVLSDLHGDAYLQGAHEAATATNGDVPAFLRPVVEGMPDDYWDKWKPGFADAAVKDADGGLKELLDQADVTIKGLTDSAIDRMGNVLADGLARGDSFQTTAKAVTDIVADPARADVIANTEFARAMSAANVDTYAANGVEQVDWIAEDDACQACLDNEDGSPYDLGDAPTVPEHPDCRCAVGPHV